jgi:hypothetical protein
MMTLRPLVRTTVTALAIPALAVGAFWLFVQ